MSSLRHLTTRQQICTIISNAVVELVLSKNQLYQQKPEENASFYSIASKPALGMSTYLIDTSIMLFSSPKTTEDADSEYGDNIEEGTRSYKMLSVKSIRLLIEFRSRTTQKLYAIFISFDNSTTNLYDNKQPNRRACFAEESAIQQPSRLKVSMKFDAHGD